MFARGGRLLAGRYEILDTLGHGGFGDVYRARDRRSGAIVAVKILRSDLADDAGYVRRFQSESRIAEMLDSRHVVKVLESGTATLDNRPVHFQVTEFAGPMTLAGLLQQRHLSIAEVLTIGVQIARALEEGETHRVVHRDVTPRNVFLGADGLVKLGDFGMARTADLPTIQGDDPILGSPDYLSPEQARGESADARSDVYSLGTLIYTMVAGVPPFHAESPTAILYKKLHEDPPPLPDFPEFTTGLSEVIMRCLSRDPEARFPSARDLRLALQREMQLSSPDSGETQSFASAVSPLQLPSRPGRLGLAIAAAAIAILLAGGIGSAVMIGGIADGQFAGGEVSSTRSQAPTTVSVVTSAPPTPSPTLAPTPSPFPACTFPAGPKPCVELQDLLVPTAFTPGQPFDVVLAATNVDSQSSPWSITVTLPGLAPEAVTLTAPSTLALRRPDEQLSRCEYDPPASAFCKVPATNDKVVARDAAVELYSGDAWATGEKKQLSFQIIPPADQAVITLQIRATIRRGTEFYNYPPNSEIYDQQGYKIVEWVIPRED